MGDSKPAYMAIASAPAAKGSEIELLVKNQGPTAELLCSVKQGASACALAFIVCVSKLLSLVRANACQFAVTLEPDKQFVLRRCCGRQPCDRQRLSS